MERTDKSTEKYKAANLLAKAAKQAVKDSATQRGLWNAFHKKVTAGDAIDFIEEEKTVDEILRQAGWKK